MSNRNQLHKNKLFEFTVFCTSIGWVSEPVKGTYEVLRMRHPEASAPLIVHDGLHRKEHLTVHGESQRMLDVWFKKRGTSAIPAQVIKTASEAVGEPPWQ